MLSIAKKVLLQTTETNNYHNPNPELLCDWQQLMPMLFAKIKEYWLIMNEVELFLSLIDLTEEPDEGWII